MEAPIGNIADAVGRCQTCDRAVSDHATMIPILSTRATGRCQTCGRAVPNHATMIPILSTRATEEISTLLDSITVLVPNSFGREDKSMPHHQVFRCMNQLVGVKSIVTTVPVERIIAAGGEVCIALLASKSASHKTSIMIHQQHEISIVIQQVQPWFHHEIVVFFQQSSSSSSSLPLSRYHQKEADGSKNKSRRIMNF